MTDDPRTYQQLRIEAKAAGINTFQMDKAAVLAALSGTGDKPAPTPSPPPARVQEPHPSDVSSPAADPRAERTASRETGGRHARVPLGAMRPKLNYPTRPGYHRHWFSDTGGRIHDAGMAGYEFVEENEDGRSVKVSRRVGTNEDGSAMMGHLMEIRQEFYDEDQAVKQSRLDEIDAQITRKDAPIKSDAEDADKFYSGAGSSISVRN